MPVTPIQLFRKSYGQLEEGPESGQATPWKSITSGRMSKEGFLGDLQGLIISAFEDQSA